MTWEQIVSVAPVVAAVAALINIFMTRRVSSEQLTMQQTLKEREMTLLSEMKERELAILSALKDRELALKARELVAEDRRTSRQTLRDLAALADRVRTSAQRLVELSATLRPEALLVQAANTLGVVAEFFNTTSQSYLVTIPKDIEPIVKAVRQALAALFLELELKNRGAETAKRLQGSYETMSGEVDTLIENIRRHTNPDESP